MNSTWKITFINKNAEEEILGLSPDLQAKFLHISELIKSFGPGNVGLPHLRPLDSGLWEIRMKGKDNIARSIYVTGSGKRIVILHTFIKKTQKTPKQALKTAKLRLKELEND